MKTHTYIAFTLLSLSASVMSAPTPQLSNILGSIINPGAGNDNLFKDNGDQNGNSNGNQNSAGNENGNNNVFGNSNQAGSGNTINLKDRAAGLLDGLTSTIGSITNPTAGSGNKFLGNGNGNGVGNGNGNSAGNGNGNNNKFGNGNSAGSDNTINVSPNVSPSIALPDIALPNIKLPNISL